MDRLNYYLAAYERHPHVLEHHVKPVHVHHVLSPHIRPRHR
jgi:hypothetical protein